VVEDFLKFASRVLRLAGCKISLATKVGRPITVDPTLFIALDRSQKFNSSHGIAALQFNDGQEFGKSNISKRFVGGSMSCDFLREC
jgi:hypothetical protein